MPATNRVLSILGLADLSGRGWRVHYSFWSVLAMGFFLFGDQQLLSPNLSRIGAEFGFTNPEDYRWYIGALPAMLFFALGSLISLVIGIASDQFDRRRLLVLCVLIGESSCLGTAFAQSYPVFLALRTITGIGLGGFFPVLFSMIGDYFRAENRSTAAGWLEFSMGLGVGLGQVTGGFLAESEFLGYPGWRWSFIFMATPAFPTVLLYYILGRIPRRGSAERVLDGLSEKDAQILAIESETHRVSLKDFRRIFTNKTNILALIQGVPGMVPWGFLFVYVVDFLEQKRGYHVEDATIVALVFGITSIFGGLLGGFLGSAIYKKNRRLLPLFGGATVILGSLPCFVMINWPAKNLVFLLLMAALAGLTVSFAGINIRAILMNTNLPENRGSIFAVFNLTDKLGAAFGPFAVGLFLFVGSDLLAYNLAIACWIPCGLIWLFMSRTLPADEDRVDATLRSRARS